MSPPHGWTTEGQMSKFSNLPHKGPDRRAAIHLVGAPSGVAELGVRADAEQMKDRRCQVGRRVSVGHRHTALTVAATDDLPGPDAAAGEEAGKHVAPVVPAR